MKALISKNELRMTGYRVVQIEPDDKIFPVAEPDLFWADCSIDVVKDEFWYDPADETIKPLTNE